MQTDPMIAEIAARVLESIAVEVNKIDIESGDSDPLTNRLLASLQKVRSNLSRYTHSTRETNESQAEITDTIQLAINIIGDRDEVYRWLGTPVPNLGYATPISLLKTKEGAEEVRQELERLAYGVY
jgi:putative toxin-antitoxin system antitoxin component (TIGR02293 family)